MDIFIALLLLAALVLILCAVFEVQSRVNLLAAGLFCFVLAVALPTFNNVIR